MAVAHDRFGGIAGVVDQDFLRGDQDVYGVAIGFDVECAVRRELQQIQAGQVAGGVVQEHVFAARVAGVDAGGVLAGVPAVDCGVVLHAGVAAVPGGFGNFAEQFFGFVGLCETEPSVTVLVEKSVSRTTAYMKSSVTRTELLAFWKKMEL